MSRSNRRSDNFLVVLYRWTDGNAALAGRILRKKRIGRSISNSCIREFWDNHDLKKSNKRRKQEPNGFYEANKDILELYREHQGDYNGAAQALGINPRCVMTIWRTAGYDF
jgi:hypothetical protein